MLNQKAIFKQKSKSKIFITILCIFGLLFSYSCKCKNQVSDPNNIPTDNGLPNPDDTPPGTFSMSAATDNVVTSIVKSSTTSISDIKISFVSANNYAYTMDYTVDDANETVEANKIDKTDFQVANNVLTAKESLLNKVKALNTDNGPAEKTITINFTFKANDTSLKNNTQTLSVDVTLTHAQKFTDQTFASTVVNFQNVNYVDPNSDQNDPDVASFSFTSFQGGTLTLKQEDNSAAFSISKIEMKSKVIRRLNSSNGIKSAKEVVGDTIEGGNSSSESIKFKVELEFTDNYESGTVTNPITVEVSILQTGEWED